MLAHGRSERCFETTVQWPTTRFSWTVTDDDRNMSLSVRSSTSPRTKECRPGPPVEAVEALRLDARASIHGQAERLLIDG